MPRYMVRLDTATGRYWEARLDKPPSARRLTPDEAAWCQQQHAPVWVVASVDDALMALGAGR